VRNVEIQEQADSDATQLQVGQQLRLVDWKDRFHRFDFNNQQLFYAKINSECPLYSQAVIDDRERNLGLDKEACFLDFVSEAPVVCTLDQPRAQCGMYLEGATNGRVSDLIDFHTSLPFLQASVVKGFEDVKGSV
jgi:hypothetical protein